MSVITLKPGRRVTLAPFLDAKVVSVARDGAVKLELFTTGPQREVAAAGCEAAGSDQPADEGADSESSRFFAEFA
jgi:hypothetical protein